VREVRRTPWSESGQTAGVERKRTAAGDAVRHRRRLDARVRLDAPELGPLVALYAAAPWYSPSGRPMKVRPPAVVTEPLSHSELFAPTQSGVGRPSKRRTRPGDSSRYHGRIARSRSGLAARLRTGSAANSSECDSAR